MPSGTAIQRFAAAPPVSNGATTGPTAAFSIGNSADGTLRRIPQYGEAGSFNCTVNYFTGACLRHFLR